MLVTVMNGAGICWLGSALTVPASLVPYYLNLKNV